MKKYLLIGVVFIISLTAFAQNDYKSFFEISELMEKWEFHKAILKMDEVLKDYPKDASIYYKRGLAYYYLNDFNSAATSFAKAKELGFNKYLPFINFMTSKQYIVDEMLKYGVMDDVNLSADNDFKMVYSREDSLRGQLNQSRTCFDVNFYDLTVKIIPKKKSIEGSNKIFFTTTEETEQIQIDLFSNYDIKTITRNGKKLQYKREFNSIFIYFGEILQANKNYNLTIEYFGKPREAPKPPWNGGFIWEKERSKWWVGVACEHLGASSWWPCKDHLTEKPDSMLINVQVPKKYQAIANGNLRSTYPVDEDYTNFEWFVSYPINSYCVTFYMGDFVNFNEEYINVRDTLNIDYYVLPHHLNKAKEYYKRTKEIVEVYEKLYGEYPYKRDGMALIEAPYKGMEHQSAIAIGDDYNPRKEDYIFKDTDYKSLLVHEIAHEWWGNTVTMSDMADAWISESFATYSEILLLENKYGYKQYIIASADKMRYIFNIVPIVGIRDVNDNTFFLGDIYNKGASMLNNLRCIINNDTLFFALIKKFYEENQFKTITSSDFINFVNNYTGNDYTDFFNKFLYDVEPPVLEYSFTLKKGVLEFTFRWINVGSNFKMPFSITINDNMNYRVEGSTENQTIEKSNVKTFYLPNENLFKLNYLSKNSFTYYWTSWKKSN